MVQISKVRDHSIDYFKGLLVIGMVYTHALQFFSDPSMFPSIHISTEFFNLITFSGFVFCFGYVNQLAYYSKPFSLVGKKMFFTGLKTIVAFYISGLAFQVFIGRLPLTFETVMPIVLLQVIPGWSEFLVSFTLIIFIGLVFFPIFIWLSRRPKAILGFSLLLLVTTFINYSQVESTYLGILIGTDLFPTFPVIQYMPYYLIGMYFGKFQIGFQWRYVFASSLGTIIFIVYLAVYKGQLPGRFPPSIFWIVGPSFFLYIYYLVSRLLNRWGIGAGFLKIMGENVLFYLIISNVIIFSLASVLESFIIGPWRGLFFTIFLLFVITYFIMILAGKPKENRQNRVVHD
ncbi:acyltransferase family protein [Bacillus sp. PS06]|uniref:acyltransferase family protein n=1 Tax=Bacillus sp. PS06 TaxID=2764176 RepID=UPI00177EC459|nr:acyltransferase family protein [Bacillus sp. PS06]MBD8068664.1 hypothetical protein [Bacillus sp. PS06]